MGLFGCRTFHRLSLPRRRYRRIRSRFPSALGAISEDGSILGKSLIFVGLAEGVCLYGLIISFMILGKL